MHRNRSLRTLPEPSVQQLLVTLPFLLLSLQGTSQAFGTIWQNRIGGNYDDVLKSAIPTMDGGFMVVGESPSGISGDKTEGSLGGDDAWLMKLDANGSTIEWQRTLGSGGDEQVTSVLQTTDGGFVIGGTTNEGGFGWENYWLVRLDADGTDVWEHFYGGSDRDILRAVCPTSDGGYLMCGRSSSDSSGLKTSDCLGGTDYWLIKVDASGQTIEWQTTIGGAGDDDAFDVIQLIDGGYAVAGRSRSNTSAFKTENCIGDWDYWIVKLTENGTIAWENTLGGLGVDYLFCVREDPSGGLFLAGSSDSPISADKSEGSVGDLDFWVIKLTPEGEIEWQNTIGGVEDDSPHGVQYMGGHWIVAGSSSSGVSGDKMEPCRGAADYWLIDVSATGELLCQRTIGGDYDDLCYSIATTPAGVLVGGTSSSPVSYEQAEPSLGGYDYWVLLVDAGACLEGMHDFGPDPTHVYPNPTGDVAYIKDVSLRSGSIMCLCQNMNAQCLGSIPCKRVGMAEVACDLSALPDGAYQLTLRDMANRIRTTTTVLLKK
jgi:hypothetical protein